MGAKVKFSIWQKYKIASIVSLIFIMTIFFILSIYIHTIIGFIISMVLGLIRSILLHSIRCPKCNKPLNNWTTIFSGNNDGMFSPISKICKNCGCDFTKSE